MDHARFCRITYWKGNERGGRTASCEKADWDFCDVSPLSTVYSFGEQTFTPEQDFQRQKLIAFLAQAYEAGLRDKLSEVQDVLGIPRNVRL